MDLDEHETPYFWLDQSIGQKFQSMQAVTAKKNICVPIAKHI